MKIGLDVGGTKTDAVAVDAAGAILGRVRLATGWGPDAVVRTVLEAVRALSSDAGIDRRAIRSVGIGIPGQVEPGTARVVHAVNLGVDELDLAAAVGPELGVPVRVENDVKAAAFGAYALHGATGSMAYLNLGTGIAAGIVADGELWRGARGTAGEVGHISIDPNGPLCRCGQRGCIEALAGRRGHRGALGAPRRPARAGCLRRGRRGRPDRARTRGGPRPRRRGRRAHPRADRRRRHRRPRRRRDGARRPADGGRRRELARQCRGIPVHALAAARASASELLPAGSPAAALGAALVGASAETPRGSAQPWLRS